MTSPNDAFIDAIERRKKPLDEALEAYRVFRQRLDALPPELADEALEMLVQAQAQKPDNKTALPTKTESGNGDLSGRTALECAEIILTENHNQPMHFAVVARKAMARGYKGRTSGSAEEVESRTAQSFWAAMSRSRDLQSVGKGLYKMRSKGERERVADNNSPLFVGPKKGSHFTQADAAAKVLEEEGKALSTRKIVELMVQRGYYPGKINHRNFENSVYSNLRRDPGRFTKVARGMWGLTKWEAKN